MLEYLLIAIALIICTIGSYTDLKIREVPDWLNFAGIISGIGIHAIGAVMGWNIWYFAESLFGLAIAFGIGSLMYYSGQWGGGDSKMLMALGALLGLRFQIEDIFITTLVYISIIGALYGLVWTLGLALQNWKRFAREFSELMSGMKVLRLILMCSIFIGLIVQFFVSDFFQRVILALLFVFVPFLTYLFYIIRTVEKCCMLKNVNPSVVTEGDWVAKDVFVAGKRICGPKDLGITKTQLTLLQKLGQQGKIKKVLIKYGIPFVPSFLMGLVAALLFKNPLVLLL